MKKRCAALCAAALLHVVPAIAQEMNYTPFQLGARSALMGGAAVGGVRDSSATFYNPGALGFVTDPSLSVSANAFRYGQLKIYSALGSGQDATADLFDVVPLLVSGSAKLEWGHDWSVGYAILTRQHFSPINISNSKDVLRSAEGFPLAFSSVDVYNVVVGLSRRTTSPLIGAGVVVSYGRGTAAGNLDFVGDTASPRGLRSDVIERDVSYFATSAFVSFTYFF